MQFEVVCTIMSYNEKLYRKGDYVEVEDKGDQERMTCSPYVEQLPGITVKKTVSANTKGAIKKSGYGNNKL